MDSFCRICGIILENTPKQFKYCGSRLCNSIREQWERDKNNTYKKRLESNPEYRLKKEKTQNRPWGSACIEHILERKRENPTFDKHQLSIYLANDLNRRYEDILEMLEYCEEKGFENVIASYDLGKNVDYLIKKRNQVKERNELKKGVYSL